ncbi:MAG: class I SAM-dependent methyltransferase [Candidatus Nanopelagicus sp.]
MEYIKDIFDAPTFEDAKKIVITPDPIHPDKFEKGTEYLIDVIAKHNIVKENDIVLDFGCGVGRMSKALIEQFNCNVIGSDISMNMLIFSTLYVNNAQKFVTCNKLTSENYVNTIISSFALQHTKNPAEEIQNLYNVLKPSGYLVLLDDHNTRYYPGGWRDDLSIIWYNDHFSIRNELEKYLVKIETVPYLYDGLDIVIYQKQAISK